MDPGQILVVAGDNPDCWDAVAAIGTWAAVVVALGLALKEGLSVWISKRSGMRILASLLCVEIRSLVPNMETLRKDVQKLQQSGVVTKQSFAALVTICSYHETKIIQASLDKLHLLPPEVASRLAVGLNCYLQAVGMIRRADDLFDKLPAALVNDQIVRVEESLGYAVHYLKPVERTLSNLTGVPGVEAPAT